ncbi:MAG TPA: family 78 glycoside hydrolase catalytic domain, partial [Sphingomonas sp.]|nr:family 78 glycoside hydrolase catalytic domain [Sphingomonas sp.]
AGSFGRPKLIAQLRLVFADGSDRTIVSDASWQAAGGPIVFSSIYGGEDVDARLLPAGWDRADRAPAGFVAATPVAAPGGRLQACGTAAVAVMDRYDAPRFSEPRPGVIVADLGRNFAGRPVVGFRGLRRGQTVTMKPAELLLADGTIDQTSMTGTGDGYNGVAFTHVSAGAADETYRPRFTFTGFRYLQFEGVARGAIASLVGEFLHLDTPAIGRFRCSDHQVEATHGLIVQALRSNLQSVVTDCPHREKLGWLEQIYLNAGTIMYNRDAIALYEKMAADMRSGQQPGGLVPSITPEFVVFQTKEGKGTVFRDTPEWGCAIVLAAWDAYRFHGDAAILRDSWPHMQAYARHLAARAKDGLLDYGLGDWYDIGPKRGGVAQLTSKKMTGTATWYAVLTTMARVARVLGDPAAAQRCTADAARVRDTINVRLLDPRTARYDRGSQTAQAMALALGIVPDALRGAALDLLIADIRARNDHVTAGDIGFHYVVRALTDARRPDVLYAMLRRTDAPSYGYQLAQGATALTESWDADRRNSQNHFMLGHVESWFYGALGGIRMAFGDEGPPIVIAPQMPTGMSSVDVGYDSVLGTIRSTWRRSGDGARIEVEVPAGAQASVRLPALAADVAGLATAMAPRSRDGGTWLTLGSGRYGFELRRVGA